jgi:hypothetical protein
MPGHDPALLHVLLHAQPARRSMAASPSEWLNRGRLSQAEPCGAADGRNLGNLALLLMPWRANMALCLGGPTDLIRPAAWRSWSFLGVQFLDVAGPVEVFDRADQRGLPVGY